MHHFQESNLFSVIFEIWDFFFKNKNINGTLQNSSIISGIIISYYHSYHYRPLGGGDALLQFATAV